MGLVVTPFSVEHIAVDVVEDTPTMSLVVLPLTFVASPVWPRLFTEAVSEATQPLSIVDGTVLKSVFTLFMLHIVIVVSPLDTGIAAFRVAI